MCINTVCIMSVLLVNYTYYKHCVHTQVEGTTYLYTCIEILRRNPLSQNFGPK
jgi:hypothetical protein